MTTRPLPPAQHILSFAQTLNGGGVERAMLRMAAGWANRGRYVTLMIGDRSGPLSTEIPSSVTLVPGGSGSYLALARHAALDMSRIVPDVIFCPGNHYTGIALAARQFSRAPIVAKLSNALVGTHSGMTGMAYAQWLRLHPSFIDHLVAMTSAMATEAAHAMGMSRKRISVIANPPASPKPDATAPILPAGRFILGVGRLAPQKRWDRLIAAFPRLADRTVQLVILGEGPERAAIEAQIAALDLKSRVHLLGHVADPLPAMSAATLLALTSDFEGVPGVMREALSLGTPIVSTDSSVAIPELIDSPARGTIVAREDADGLVAALEHWLTPDAVRPAPLIDTSDPIGDYLALFDRLVTERLRA